MGLRSLPVRQAQGPYIALLGAAVLSLRALNRREIGVSKYGER